jgi:hypothetical protein
MNNIRAVQVAGHTLLDQQRSVGLRPELKIFNLTGRIERQKENWFVRMAVDRLPKIALIINPEDIEVSKEP